MRAMTLARFTSLAAARRCSLLNVSARVLPSSSPIAPGVRYITSFLPSMSSLLSLTGGIPGDSTSTSSSSRGAQEDLAVEVLDFRGSSQTVGSSLLVTCEHATDRLPRPYQWPRGDEWLVGSHWSCDPGAADATRELAKAVGSVAVLSRFSRLLIDPNRPLASSTLIRTQADGRKIALNDGLSSADRDWRIWRYYLPYQLALGEVANACDPSLILSMHSFTRNYEGERREFELGVLCATHDALAHDIAADFIADGFATRINQPWSGKEGFMYAADSLAVAGGPGRRKAVMLELRNDLATDAQWRARMIKTLAKALRRVHASMTKQQSQVASAATKSVGTGSTNAAAVLAGATTCNS